MALVVDFERLLVAELQRGPGRAGPGPGVPDLAGFPHLAGFPRDFRPRASGCVSYECV